jgi:hypothetical protein
MIKRIGPPAHSGSRDSKRPTCLCNDSWKARGSGLLSGFIVVFVCILLLPKSSIGQGQSAFLLHRESRDEFHQVPPVRLFRFNETISRFSCVTQVESSHSPAAIDPHQFAARSLSWAAIGPSAGAPLHGNKAAPDNPHMIELSTSNWHPLSRSGKFGLFREDLLRWETHASLATDAALSLATNDRTFLGRGGYGYLRRYGFNVVDEANFVFFGAFLFPTLFHEDPRYIPKDQGTLMSRTAYALSRVVLTRNDAGNSEFNKSLVLATIVSTAIASAYYSPAGGTTGARVIFANVGINLASDAGFNLFKEYWPGVSRKLKLNLWLRNLIRSSVRDSIRVY